MPIEKLKHLKDGDEVYVKMKRTPSTEDNHASLRFDTTDTYKGDYCFLGDDDEFYTEEQLREKFSPRILKKGDEVEVYFGNGKWSPKKVIDFSTNVFISYDGSDILYWESKWRFPSPKVKKTLAEIEKELGMDEGTLEITNN